MFADAVKLLPFRRNAAQCFIVFIGKILVDVFGWGKQIKSRIDAEQNHLNLTAQGRHLCHSRIVGAEADMADYPVFLKSSDIVYVFP